MTSDEIISALTMIGIAFAIVITLGVIGLLRTGAL